MKALNDFFDRFADWTAEHVARALFFAFCGLIVLAWLVHGISMNLWTNDLWHLELNSPTGSITFLLVALLHNTQHRTERALNRKLDLILRALRERCQDGELCAEMDDLIGEEATASEENGG